MWIPAFAGVTEGCGFLVIANPEGVKQSMRQMDRHGAARLAVTALEGA
ncbi:MAG: hypothetical protein Tsb0016_23240 [Sphingomonadales bacterium]